MDFKFIIQMVTIFCGIMGIISLLYSIIAKQNHKYRFWYYHFDHRHYQKYCHSKRKRLNS